MSSILDDLFSGVGSLVKQAESLAPTAAAWKELIDPVKAAQQPTLGMGSGTPIIQPPPSGTVSKTPGVTIPGGSMAIWIAVGGIAIVLIFMMMGRNR